MNVLLVNISASTFMNKPKPILSLPVIEYEQVDDLLRWTIYHPAKINKAEFFLGSFLILFPAPHLFFASWGIFEAYTVGGKFAWPDSIWQTLPPICIFLFVMIFISAGVLKIVAAINSTLGKLKTVLELDQEKLVCYQQGHGGMGQRSTVELAMISQLLVLEASGNPLENETYNAEAERNLIAARGPDLNRTVVHGLDLITLNDLAKRLAIAIEKKRHEIEVVHHKLGLKPIQTAELELHFGEQGVDVQPADSKIRIQNAGKYRVIMFSPPLKLIPLLFAGILALSAIGSGILMAQQFHQGDIRFAIWALPMAICLAFSLWIFAVGTEHVTMSVRPGELTIKHGFLFRHSKHVYQSSQIASISAISAPPQKDLQIVLKSGAVVHFLNGQLETRELSWLAHLLNREVFQKP